MNRINKLGMELISYKEELTKDYPEIVRKSLFLAIEQLASGQVIDADTLALIKDETINKLGFEQYIEGNALFVKTEEEIAEEFKKLEAQLIGILNEKELNTVKTSVVAKQDLIMINRGFVFDEEFVSKFFGVEDEQNMLELMKRRGFVEKFAVLRLNTIFKPFILKVTEKYPEIAVDLSYVFFDADDNGYKMDIFFPIKEEMFDDLAELGNYVEKVKTVVGEAEEEFAAKTIV